MNIRPATVDDVASVIPMVSKICALHESWDSAKYGFRKDPGERYRSWLRSRATDPRSVFLVAQREDHLAGFLVGTTEKEIPIYQIEEYGFIHDLWIEQEYRNEGIARQMVMLAVERFRQIGVKQIRLDTAAKNDAAKGLFQRCGFRVSTIEMLQEL